MMCSFSRNLICLLWGISTRNAKQITQYWNVWMQNIQIKFHIESVAETLENELTKNKKKVLTRHSEGFGYIDGEFHLLMEELKHGWFWMDFRMPVGQFKALLQLLCLIREDRVSTGPTDRRYFVIYCLEDHCLDLVCLPSLSMLLLSRRDIRSAQHSWLDDVFVCKIREIVLNPISRHILCEDTNGQFCTNYSHTKKGSCVKKRKVFPSNITIEVNT